MKLDNPFWHAMIGPQSAFAQGAGRARRYLAHVNSHAAVESPTPAAYADLASLVERHEVVAVFGTAPAELPKPWTKAFEVEVEQMVCLRPNLVEPVDAVQLRAADVPAMLDLAEATRPGPLAAGALTLGRFFGVWEDGRLVAMAGERARLDGYHEISSVCTASHRRGRGLASGLVSKLIRDITAAGDAPFLHVAASNAGAIRAYRRLGFESRTRMWVAGLARGPEG